MVNQKKTMKTQVVQVNEKNEEERQVCGSGLNRLEHPRTVEEEFLRKEPFFVNHYYSHLVGQCCCQQHGMMVRKGETTVQSSITQTYEKSENSRKPQHEGQGPLCRAVQFLGLYFSFFLFCFMFLFYKTWSFLSACPIKHYKCI